LQVIDDLGNFQQIVLARRVVFLAVENIVGQDFDGLRRHFRFPWLASGEDSGKYKAIQDATDCLVRHTVPAAFFYGELRNRENLTISVVQMRPGSVSTLTT